MRARQPDSSGYVERDGVRLHWERFGSSGPHVLFVPTWHIVHSRSLKMQVPHLARRFQVTTFDPRGNGRSDRPERGYAVDDHMLDALAVMDATGVERAAVVSASKGSNPAALLAARHPERVERLCLVGPALGADWRGGWFTEAREAYEGWGRFNANFWREHYVEFLEFFFTECFSEPHSTKPFDDTVAWGQETTPEVLIQEASEYDGGVALAALGDIRCPVLIYHGSADRVIPLAQAEAAAEAIPDAQLVVVEGGGHRPDIRDPAAFNLTLDEFLGEGARPVRRSVPRSLGRAGRRALYVSSPIGLGHVHRDLAIARELRALAPDLQIDWLAQDGVARVLEAAGETVHPASADLASESAHIDEATREHELHVFQAIREMDEILLANFMRFLEVARDGHYDLWIGDEAWELDLHLHENPRLKAAPYAFLTDFVGWLPMAEGSREADVTADYNAENIAHVERHPHLRDAAVFVGSEADIVPRTFGPGLPWIPEWVPRHFGFSGYVLPFDPAADLDAERIRADHGAGPGEKLIVAAVGGSGAGVHLLRRIAQAFALLRRDLPEAKLLLVAGPRIDPALFEPVEGMRVAGYVHELYRVLASCDLAVVQGGLTTTMELVAGRRPFVYVPLRGHFEQNHHVAHRLRRYGAPEPTPYEEAQPERLAELMLERLGAPVDYLPVETDGAARAAALIAPLLEERKGAGRVLAPLASR